MFPLKTDDLRRREDLCEHDFSETVTNTNGNIAKFNQMTLFTRDVVKSVNKVTFITEN